MSAGLPLSTFKNPTQYVDESRAKHNTRSTLATIMTKSLEPPTLSAENTLPALPELETTSLRKAFETTKKELPTSTPQHQLVVHTAIVQAPPKTYFANGTSFDDDRLTPWDMVLKSKDDAGVQTDENCCLCFLKKRAVPQTNQTLSLKTEDGTIREFPMINRGPKGNAYYPNTLTPVKLSTGTYIDTSSALNNREKEALLKATSFLPNSGSSTGFTVFFKPL